LSTSHPRRSPTRTARRCLAAIAWVGASAGSGKTKVLTDRVLRLLLTPGQSPQRILCLTFTKAAAATMAIRVFERLGQWVALDDERLRTELVKLDGEAPDAERLRLARRLFARAVETPGGLKIETIHAFCERILHMAPFEANVFLGARVYVPVHRPWDGKVVFESGRRAGKATACVRITDPTFPPGEQVPFYARFNLPGGSFTASGTCTLVSNNVPEAGLVLAGCALSLVQVPRGFVGGTVSSTSVFNPRRLPGYSTGSYYTLYVYRDGRRHAEREEPEEREAARAEAE